MVGIHNFNALLTYADLGRKNLNEKNDAYLIVKMTLLIIDKQWPEPLENNDSGDYY
jgi:hypothetical protein